MRKIVALGVLICVALSGWSPLVAASSSTTSLDTPNASAEVSLVSVDDTSFTSEVEQYQGGVLVDVYASWCGPCRQMLPIVESLVAEVSPEIKVIKMNLDHSKMTAKRLGISRIPALIFYVNGEEKSRFIGSKTKQELLNEIDRVLR